MQSYHAAEKASHALPANLEDQVQARVDAMPITHYANDNFYSGFSEYRWASSPKRGWGSRPTKATGR